MELLRWKTRIAVLWIILAVNHIAYIFQSVLEPGILKDFREVMLYSLTTFFFLPCLVAWLTLSLKNSATRWLNFVLAVLFALVKALVLIGDLNSGRSTAVPINAFWGFLAAALIIWYAWKWPKQES